MTLGWILWFATLLPQPAADSMCLGTTVYLEARDQSLRGQQAVAEVALRRQESGFWGHSMCEVVTARSQFAPGIVDHRMRLTNFVAWEQSISLAVSAERNWALPADMREELVPGASHFLAHALASPNWRDAPQVAVIDDHTFLRVQNLTPRRG